MDLTTSYVKFLATVRFDSFNFILSNTLLLCSFIFNHLFNHIMHVTSVNDSKHMPTSYHYKNLAFDIRTSSITLSECKVFIKHLKAFLGNCFDIVLEKDHIHIEFDSKRYTSI